MLPELCPSMFATAFTNCNYPTTPPPPPRQNALITIDITPRTMGITHRHRVISTDVMLMSRLTHFEVRFTCFLALIMSSSFSTIYPKRGCALYTKLRSIHHFKGLIKGCVLYTGASYTREITVYIYNPASFFPFSLALLWWGSYCYFLFLPFPQYLMMASLYYGTASFSPFSLSLPYGGVVVYLPSSTCFR